MAVKKMEIGKTFFPDQIAKLTLSLNFLLCLTITNKDLVYRKTIV